MKKKKSRYFDIYISNIIKNISDSCGITSNAKQQFNSILCIITKIVSDKTRSLIEISNKKTISEKEVSNALKILLPSQLCKNSLSYGQGAFEKFNSTSQKRVTRQEKSGIIFPPSIFEKFLRNFGHNNVMVSCNAPIYFAGAIEYLAFEILENACLQAKDKKHVRITIRDLEMGVRLDNDFNIFFNNNKISFLGGGVVPYIHNSLINKKLTRNVKISHNYEKKKHRFRPGTVSIKEIKKLQKTSNCLTFAKFPFEKLVRKIVEENNDKTIKICKDVFVVIQHFVEQKLTQLLQQSNFAAIHAGRTKLIPNDIKFILSIREENGNPYKNEEKKSVLEINSTFELNDENNDENNDEENIIST
jgi:histone H3